MVRKKARKDETEAAAPRKPTTRKRTKRRQAAASPAASGGAAGMCDDIIRNIFARLPARTLVASMALSKHHCRMILSPELRSLHCRTRRSPDAGRLGCDAPTRSLTGTRYISTKYINTCNGVLLFAHSRRCVLWNPCVANSNSEKEVIIPVTENEEEDCVLGWGYGTRSQTYKLLVVQRCKGNSRYDRRLRLSNLLYLFNASTMKMSRLNLPWNLMLESSQYAFCWGYKPTLVSPENIIGEVGRDVERCLGHATDIFEVLKTVNEQEKRTGREATLTTMCFMDYLVRILRRLPENMQEAIECTHEYL
ncbi:hypothetical protein PR202_ga13957 [Eleusine coracana subsp. coracana]|uniref:F-box protein n=1 Tax=Eleusine coracana subsp. coracana TaxID=191504 RepID=A0AAV5CGC4_ELECO|nr:hypothetical protein PR202_ga13957 [Eleusine coracana subsp. coracana]